MSARYLRLAMVGLLAVYVVLVGLTAGGYGITWDSPENFDIGERFARYLTTRDASLLDVRRDVPRAAGVAMPPFESAWSRQVPQALWPVTNTLSGMCYLVFAEWLRWLNPVDAHHAVLVPLVVLLALAFNRLVAERFGEGWGLLALLFLLTWPRLFGHAHNNIKDLPLAAFFVATLFAGTRWATGGRWRWLALTALTFGCALGTRPNGLFALVILGLWVLVRRRAATEPPRLRTVLGVALALPVGVGLVVAAWPLLYVTPPTGFPVPGVERPLDYLALAIEYISTINQRADHGWTLYAPRMLAAVTPVAVVALVLIGVGVAVRRVGRGDGGADLALLSVIWIAITIGRTVTPWSAIYDGVRHVLEALPALVILAVIGARSLAASRPWRPVGGVLVIAAVLEGVVGIASTHPFQTTYFNVAAGGLEGAQRRDVPYACDYWASSYRDAARWLNEHAPPGSDVSIPVAGHLAPWLEFRTDLRVSGAPGVLGAHEESPRHYLLLHPRRTSTQSLRPREVPFHRFHPRVLELLRSVRRVERGGGLIYEIYEADPAELAEVASRFPGVVRHAGTSGSEPR